MVGIYMVIIIDGNGNMVIVIEIISEFDLLVFIGVEMNVSCNVGDNGVIDVIVIGGMVFYIYVWSNGVMMQDLSGFIVGIYIFMVMDVNNCIII